MNRVISGDYRGGGIKRGPKLGTCTIAYFQGLKIKMVKVNSDTVEKIEEKSATAKGSVVSIFFKDGAKCNVECDPNIARCLMAMII